MRLILIAVLPLGNPIGVTNSSNEGEQGNDPPDEGRNRGSFTTGQN